MSYSDICLHIIGPRTTETAGPIIIKLMPNYAHTGYSYIYNVWPQSSGAILSYLLIIYLSLYFCSTAKSWLRNLISSRMSNFNQTLYAYLIWYLKIIT